MQIDEKSAIKVVYDGRQYLVASERCRARFDADPAKFAAIDQHASQHQHKRGCC
mgnify:CR=1 FL=1